MADYYTPTVVDPMIPLAAMLPIERLFLSQVFDEELTSEAAYYCSDDGVSDLISLDVRSGPSRARSRHAETSSLAQKLIDEQPDAILGDDDIDLDMCGDLWADVLQDIVRRSPDLDHLTVTMAFTCSKMRPDGFGGLAMLITANTSGRNRPTRCSTASTRKPQPTGRSAMAIPDYARANFETLMKAAKAGDLALMECTEARSGETRYVLCAVGRDDATHYVMTPFGHLAPGNPYEAYIPPA
jgi:hypothetical protein